MNWLEEKHVHTLTSLMLTSASTYCRPFWMMEMSAAGGTRAPLMFDWLMWLSMPNVNAEWENPASREQQFQNVKVSLTFACVFSFFVPQHTGLVFREEIQIRLASDTHPIICAAIAIQHQTSRSHCSTERQLIYSQSCTLTDIDTVTDTASLWTKTL